MTLQNDIPSFFFLFSTLRGYTQDLVNERNNVDLTTSPDLATAIDNLTSFVRDYGDLDENYSIIATDALKGDTEAREQLNALATAYDS